MKEFFGGVRYDDISFMSAWGLGLGEHDPWDAPVWSGFAMHEFFKANPIDKADFSSELIDKLLLYIECGAEESVPLYIYDYLDKSKVVEEKAVEARDAILKTLLPYQTEAEECALELSLESSKSGESRDELWTCFFIDLYEFAAKVSFKEVNGYDLPNEFDEDLKEGEALKLQDCDWPGVYAFKCKASGYVKIGMSNKSVYSRVKGQLSSLPCGGEFMYAIKCLDPCSQEISTHKFFNSHRVYPRKEWFDLSQNSVVEYLTKLGG